MVRSASSLPCSRASSPAPSMRGADVYHVGKKVSKKWTEDEQQSLLVALQGG